MSRPVEDTAPPTFAVTEVLRILRGSLSASTLQTLDEKGIIRPSYYFDSSAVGKVISPETRDSRVKAGRSPADPPRRYTYPDLYWLSLFVHVRDGLNGKMPRKAFKSAGRAVLELQRICTGEFLPSGSRLIFHGEEVYFLRDGEVAYCLTRPGELALTQLLADKLVAEVQGRVSVLMAHRTIREIASPKREEGFPTFGPIG